MIVIPSYVGRKQSCVITCPPVLAISLSIICFLRFSQVAKDPLGELDSFSTLPTEQQSVWEKDDGRTLHQTVASLKKLEVQYVVDVKLVGFDGEGCVVLSYRIVHINCLQSKGVVRIFDASHSFILSPRTDPRRLRWHLMDVLGGW